MSWLIALASAVVGCTDRALPSEGGSAEETTTGDDDVVDDGSSGAVEPTSVGTSSATSTTGTSTTTNVTTDDGSSTAETPACADMCQSLVDGSCVGLQDSCELTCADATTYQGPEVAGAFEACVSTEPLCFSFLEDCMYAEIYGDTPVEQTYVFEGLDFGALEGRSVYSVLQAHEQLTPGTTAVVVGGAFEVEATVTLPFDRHFNRYQMYLFVDANGDGLCTPGIDYGHVAYLDLDRVFDDLRFAQQGTPNDTSADHVCNQF